VSKRRLSNAWQAGLILLVLLGVLVIAALLTPNKADLPALSSRSAQPDGAKALYAWLEKMGYHVSNQSTGVFAVPDGVKAVFLLDPDPAVPIMAQEWRKLDQFIQDGGILVAAGELSGSETVARHYGFSVTGDGAGHSIGVFVPVLKSPPLDFSKINVLSKYRFTTSNLDYLPVLVEFIHPYAVEQSIGKGRVILVADSVLFNNVGLKNPGAAKLLLNLLTPIPHGSAVWFDEWHHGERGIVSAEETRSGLSDWLIFTPAGRSVLWVLIVAFVGLALMGIYFGRPLAEEKDNTRRAPLEFVTALARLNQRAGHRGEILGSYYRRLKRSLIQRYRIDPDLSDREIESFLAETHPEIDAPALANLLERLKQPRPSEQDMVDIAHQAAEWIQKIEHSSAGKID
jgi:hypothetical protein